MDKLGVCVLCISLVLIFGRIVAGVSAADSTLIKSLLGNAGYDKRVLPVNETTGRVRVSLGVTVERVNSVDDRQQEIFWVGYVTAMWNNPHLRWKPEEWGGRDSIFFSEEDIWVPDVSILERLNEDIGFKDQKRRPIHVNHLGDTRWLLGGDVISTRCPLKINRFPFDEQSCPMHIGSYVIPASQLETVDAGLSYYDGIGGSNALWTVTGWESTVVNYTYDTNLGSMRFDYLYFKLHLKRKATYYVINIITPLLLMSLLMVVVFKLPCDTGEKISFGITLLLSFNVIQLVITETMPQTSDSMPYISIYVACLMGLSAFSIPFSILVIYVDSYGSSCLPRWLLCRVRRHDVTTSLHNNPTFINNEPFILQPKAVNAEVLNNGAEQDVESDQNFRAWVQTVLDQGRLSESDATKEEVAKTERQNRKAMAKCVDSMFFYMYLLLIMALTLVCGILMVFG